MTLINASTRSWFLCEFTVDPKVDARWLTKAGGLSAFDVDCGDDSTVRCHGWRLHLVPFGNLRYEAAFCRSGES